MGSCLGLNKLTLIRYHVLFSIFGHILINFGPFSSDKLCLKYVFTKSQSN